MTGPFARVVSYRFRATVGRRWGGYAGLAILIGLLGGVAMASIAAARRTQSSYPRFLAGTNPSDLTVSTYGLASTSAATPYSAATTAEIAQLPLVRHVESWAGAPAVPLGRDGRPDTAAAINTAVSVDGLYFDEDRATAIEGRMADPSRPDEFVTTRIGAQVLGLRVGDVVPFGVFTPAELSQPGFDFGAVVKPADRVNLRLVGLVKFNNEVVEDDTDRVPTNLLFTPAFIRPLLAEASTQGTWYGLQLAHGARDVPAVERELIGVFPKGSIYSFRVTALAEAKVERAVKPESIALAVFGTIAALAALAIATQSVSRQLWTGAEDREALRALGAGPGMIAADGLAGILAAVVAGSVVACGLAVALSPIAPLGPVRQVYPGRGVSIDWTVLALGLAVLVGVLGTIAVVLARRQLQWRTAAQRRDMASGSSVVRAATSAGLSAPATVGARLALEPGRGRTAVPVRSALLGATLAIVLVVATVTFGSSLTTLVSSPALYGWNWNYALSSVNAVPPAAETLLDHDPDVAGWSEYRDLNGQIDGQNLPVLLANLTSEVNPPILSGHTVQRNDQIVLGAATLAALHAHLGDTVVISYGKPDEAPLYIPPTRMVVVGTSTLPALAGSSTLADHVSMGVGAILPIGVAPPAFQAAATDPDPNLDGPPLVFVRLRHGVTGRAGMADMQRIAAAADAVFAKDPAAQGDSVSVVTVQRPAEIVNYGATSAAPLILAGGLAVGAVVALGLTLVASVRRRRRDLALLKTLGFTRRQLAATVAWQASVIAAIGVAAGVPVGVAAGRWLWTLFARQIYAVPRPTVPWSVALVAVGAFILVNVVAAIPGRIAARTPAAMILRSE